MDTIRTGKQLDPVFLCKQDKGFCPTMYPTWNPCKKTVFVSQQDTKKINKNKIDKLKTIIYIFCIQEIERLEKYGIYEQRYRRNFNSSRRKKAVAE